MTIRVVIDFTSENEGEIMSALKEREGHLTKVFSRSLDSVLSGHDELEAQARWAAVHLHKNEDQACGYLANYPMRDLRQHIDFIVKVKEDDDD